MGIQILSCKFLCLSKFHLLSEILFIVFEPVIINYIFELRK